MKLAAERNIFRYRGYIYDRETELYYLQSRYYDPSIGRFINADGLVSTGQGILGNNMYAYCNNNPVNRCDYTGYCYSTWVYGIPGPCPGYGNPGCSDNGLSWKQYEYYLDCYNNGTTLTKTVYTPPQKPTETDSGSNTGSNPGTDPGSNEGSKPTPEDKSNSTLDNAKDRLGKGFVMEDYGNCAGVWFVGFARWAATTAGVNIPTEILNIALRPPWDIIRLLADMFLGMMTNLLLLVISYLFIWKNTILIIQA